VLAGNSVGAGIISRVALNLTKLDRIAGRARRLGEEIAPQLRALESVLDDDPELDEETPPSILLHCAVAYLIATEGRAATLHRLAQMVEAVGAEFIEPEVY
jgi:hypothetical protein